VALALSQPRQLSVGGWLRVTVKLTATVLLLILCVALYYPARPFTRQNPVPRLFLAGFGAIAGMRLKIRGEKVHRGAFLLANHVSWLDIPAIAATTGSAFVGHDGLASMPLTIFPEGTTSDGTGLLPFKSSLLSALEPLPSGIAVQPVLLDFGPEAADIAWIGDEHGVDNFLRLLARSRPVQVTVHFLPVLSGAQTASRKTIAQAAREAMLARLNG